MRTESDSIGTMEVPDEAYYGVQTLRGFKNFRITEKPAYYGFILNVVRIKKASAAVNLKVGSLDEKRARAIIAACDEILGGNSERSAEKEQKNKGSRKRKRTYGRRRSGKGA